MQQCVSFRFQAMISIFLGGWGGGGLGGDATSCQSYIELRRVPFSLGCCCTSKWACSVTVKLLNLTDSYCQSPFSSRFMLKVGGYLYNMKWISCISGFLSISLHKDDMHGELRRMVRVFCCNLWWWNLSVYLPEDGIRSSSSLLVHIRWSQCWETVIMSKLP